MKHSFYFFSVKINVPVKLNTAIYLLKNYDTPETKEGYYARLHEYVSVLFYADLIAAVFHCGSQESASLWCHELYRCGNLPLLSIYRFLNDNAAPNGEEEKEGNAQLLF